MVQCVKRIVAFSFASQQLLDFLTSGVSQYLPSLPAAKIVATTLSPWSARSLRVRRLDLAGSHFVKSSFGIDKSEDHNILGEPISASPHFIKSTWGSRHLGLPPTRAHRVPKRIVESPGRHCNASVPPACKGCKSAGAVFGKVRGGGNTFQVRNGGLRL